LKLAELKEKIAGAWRRQRSEKFSIPTQWSEHAPAAPPITVIECPSCKKQYEMKGLIPLSAYQATVVCECKEPMEVFLDKHGNMKAIKRGYNTL